jgi:methanogenic corrinoid protein MtbC1
MSLARSWGTGGGPLAVLACAPGERHDLALVAFGLALRGRGWRIAFLGADTPSESIAEAAGMLAPALIVVSGVTSDVFERSADELAAVARSHPLAIAGAGATEQLAQRLGCRFLADDPVAHRSRVPPPASVSVPTVA